MKQLLILSGKGGTGKTTMASAFIRLGQIKTYADCDVDAPNLHLIMNQEIEPKRREYYGMDKAVIDRDLCINCDMCRQNCRFGAIAFKDGYEVNHYECEGCGVCEFVCPEGAINLEPAVAGELMLYDQDRVFSTAKLKMGSGNSGLLVTEVKDQMKSANVATDLAIIDGSPGIGCPVIASLNGVDMALIVAEPSISGLQDMKRIIQTGRFLRVKMGVCINKYDSNIEISNGIEDFCKERNIPFLGRIPFDYEAIKAINHGMSIVDIDCRAGEAVKDIFTKALGMIMN